MEEKKKIGLLTLVIAVAGILLAFIDAIVSVSYGVIPSEPTSPDFVDLAINGPIWWRINTILMVIVIGVGLIAFLIGSEKLSTRSKHDFFGFARIMGTFVLISLSGMGDLIAQTVVECLTGNSPLYWVTREWWWTRYMPIPAVVSFFAGHRVPYGTDMIIASFIGVIILSVIWLQYYGKISFTKIWKLFSPQST